MFSIVDDVSDVVDVVSVKVMSPIVIMSYISFLRHTNEYSQVEHEVVEVLLLNAVVEAH